MTGGRHSSDDGMVAEIRSPVTRYKIEPPARQGQAAQPTCFGGFRGPPGLHRRWIPPSLAWAPGLGRRWRPRRSHAPGRATASRIPRWPYLPWGPPEFDPAKEETGPLLEPEPDPGLETHGIVISRGADFPGWSRPRGGARRGAPPSRCGRRLQAAAGRGGSRPFTGCFPGGDGATSRGRCCPACGKLVRW